MSEMRHPLRRLLSHLKHHHLELTLSHPLIVQKTIAFRDSVYDYTYQFLIHVAPFVRDFAKEYPTNTRIYPIIFY